MALANVGSVDRILRVVVGAGVIVYALMSNLALTSLPGLASLIVGGILILTALVSFCPLYKVFGICTNKPA